MSTNPNYAQFTADYGKLTEANTGLLAEYGTISGELDKNTVGTDSYNYFQALGEVPQGNGSTSPFSKTNPWTLFIELIVLLASSGASVLSDKAGKYASALKVEEGVNNCNSDLLNITNNTSDTTTTGLIHESSGANEIVALCSTNPTLSDALGGQSVSSLLTQFQTVSGWIYTGGTLPDDPNSHGIYFNATGTATKSGLLTSFSQMHTNEGKQGDPDNASGAATAISTTFGMNSSLLSGAQTSVQTEMTAGINTLSTILSVASALGGDMMKEVGVSNQNMRG